MERSIKLINEGDHPCIQDTAAIIRKNSKCLRIRQNPYSGNQNKQPEQNIGVADTGKIRNAAHKGTVNHKEKTDNQGSNKENNRKKICCQVLENFREEAVFGNGLGGRKNRNASRKNQRGSKKKNNRQNRSFDYVAVLCVHDPSPLPISVG